MARNLVQFIKASISGGLNWLLTIIAEGNRRGNEHNPKWGLPIFCLRDAQGKNSIPKTIWLEMDVFMVRWSETEGNISSVVGAADYP